jgi:hypothetical protein
VIAIEIVDGDGDVDLAVDEVQSRPAERGITDQGHVTRRRCRLTIGHKFPSEIDPLAQESEISVEAESGM